jgi:hypothetical protein
VKRTCRILSSALRNGRLASRVLVHVRIVTDPVKLAHLRGEAARQRRRAESLLQGRTEQSLLRGDF